MSLGSLHRIRRQHVGCLLSYFPRVIMAFLIAILSGAANGQEIIRFSGGNTLEISADLAEAISDCNVVHAPDGCSDVFDMADQGDRAALFLLSFWFLYQPGVQFESKQAALRYMLALADDAMPLAMADVGARHLSGNTRLGGIGVDPSIETGLRYLRAAFEAGVGSASLLLAREYDRGNIVEESQELATAHYELAAAQGNGLAGYLLALRRIRPLPSVGDIEYFRRYMAHSAERGFFLAIEGICQNRYEVLGDAEWFVFDDPEAVFTADETQHWCRELRDINSSRAIVSNDGN
ncbi:hypothetical protein V0U79_07575 [Hyphobacterium sp. HN65]|uniref:Sel1 repeat family protein n=1 Tax=Hyphobacterium lacteum TaxID=3116575 RepID=A0ABU7LQM6_9PROT|nr:hypothetical protein [Hyphobacterium sp. HN65]MEE2526223.1 hypothetical protein [Hyphobacterium sp. HN65]